MVRDDYFNNVKSEKDIGIIQHSQPCEGTTRNALLFFAINRFNGPAEIVAPAGFYFDENQRVIVTTDNIDLTATATAKITEEDLVTVTPEIATRQRLAPGASPEMTGFGRRPPTREVVAPPARKIGDGLGKGRIHGV